MEYNAGVPRKIYWSMFYYKLRAYAYSLKDNEFDLLPYPLLVTANLTHDFLEDSLIL
jgi:hypothetical protein